MTAWRGQDAGVRRPMTGETQLSESEIAIGLRHGFFSFGAVEQPEGRVMTQAQQSRDTLGQRVLDLICEAGDKGVTSTELMARTGLSRNSLRNHTGAWRSKGVTVSCGESFARVHMMAGASAEQMEAAAAAAREAWHLAREPARNAKKKAVRERVKEYCKEWRKRQPKAPKPMPKAVAEPVKQPAAPVTRKPAVPAPTVTWCAPHLHHIEKRKPGRYESQDVPQFFRGLPSGVYPLPAASCAARSTK